MAPCGSASTRPSSRSRSSSKRGVRQGPDRRAAPPPLRGQQLLPRAARGRGPGVLRHLADNNLVEFVELPREVHPYYVHAGAPRAALRGRPGPTRCSPGSSEPPSSGSGSCAFPSTSRGCAASRSRGLSPPAAGRDTAPDAIDASRTCRPSGSTAGAEHPGEGVADCIGGVARTVGFWSGFSAISRARSRNAWSAVIGAMPRMAAHREHAAAGELLDLVEVTVRPGQQQVVLHGAKGLRQPEEPGSPRRDRALSRSRPRPGLRRLLEAATVALRPAPACRVRVPLPQQRLDCGGVVCARARPRRTSTRQARSLSAAAASAGSGWARPPKPTRPAFAAPGHGGRGPRPGWLRPRRGGPAGWVRRRGSTSRRPSAPSPGTAPRHPGCAALAQHPEDAAEQLECVDSSPFWSMSSTVETAESAGRARMGRSPAESSMVRSERSSVGTAAKVRSRSLSR